MGLYMPSSDSTKGEFDDLNSRKAQSKPTKEILKSFAATTLTLSYVGADK